MEKNCNCKLGSVLEKAKSIDPVKALVLVAIVIATYFISTNLLKSDKAEVSGSSNLNQAIEEWVEENPGKILDSVNKHMQELQREAQENQGRKAKDYIEQNKAKVLDSKNVPSVNDGGKITVVEFFDYHCGHCKRVTKDITRLAKEYKNVTFVFRDFPIMGQQSYEMAKVVTAVHMKYPNNYIKVHKDFMSKNVRTEAEMKAVVNSHGMNYDNLKSYMTKNSSEIEKRLKDNIQMARDLGIRGTPAFIINGELVPGAVPYETLKAAIEAQL